MTDRLYSLMMVLQALGVVYIMGVYHTGDSPLLAGVVIFGTLLIALYGYILITDHPQGHHKAWQRKLVMILGILSGLIVAIVAIRLVFQALGFFVLFIPFASYLGVLPRYVFGLILNTPLFAGIWLGLGVVAVCLAIVDIKRAGNRI